MWMLKITRIIFEIKISNHPFLSIKTKPNWLEFMPKQIPVESLKNTTKRASEKRNALNPVYQIIKVITGYINSMFYVAGHEIS